MIDITIVEDQMVQAEKIRSLVLRWAEEKGISVNLSTYGSGEELLFNLEDMNEPDIVLMDIQMGNISGMDAAREMRSRGIESDLIFITAISDYVFEGYDVGAVNYILKPISREKLEASLNKALDNISGGEDRSIVIEKQKINVDEIFYIDVMGHNLTFHTRDNEISTRLSMVSVLKELDGSQFVKCHKAYAVNVSKIKKIDKDSVKLDNDDAIPLSRNYKKQTTQKFISYHKGGDMI